MSELAGLSPPVTETHSAIRYASRLLSLLGSDAQPRGMADHPALAWRRAGLMDITGLSSESPLMCPASLAAAADGTLMALRALAPDPTVLPDNGALLLGERARLMGLRRGGRVSGNSSCRLLDARDGRIALNLARKDDWDLMPTLLGRGAVSSWEDVARGVGRQDAADLIALGAELSLPIALDAPLHVDSPFAVLAQGNARRRQREKPLVLDFSALWAGPLAASLLGMMGAEVVKIESIHRPDGARNSHTGFYALMNGGKQSIVIDFNDPHHLARLLVLMETADIVIEGSRPRALKRLGIDRDAAVARGCVWIWISGHDDPERVAFGDDAAVAAGLPRLMEQAWGTPVFVGDAVADPLTGLHAALAAWAAWGKGQGMLIHLALSTTTAFCMQAEVVTGERLQDWQAMAINDVAPLYPLRRRAAPVCGMGANNSELLRI